MAHFDALVIGFGKAGKTLAGDIAGRGKKVAMIEKDSTSVQDLTLTANCEVYSKRWWIKVPEKFWVSICSV